MLYYLLESVLHVIMHVQDAVSSSLSLSVTTRLTPAVGSSPPSPRHRWGNKKRHASTKSTDSEGPHNSIDLKMNSVPGYNIF